MIRAIIYDLDGVLVDACEIHRIAFNQAVQKVSNYEITIADHLSFLNGLPTLEKLNVLQSKGLLELSQSQIYQISTLKQEYTKELIRQNIKLDPQKVELHQDTQSLNMKSVCVTNSIRETAEMQLHLSGQLPFMKFVITNQDVKYAKPNPEGYVTAIHRLNLNPDECLIVEDTEKGYLAARGSDANIWMVSGPSDVTWENLKRYL